MNSFNQNRSVPDEKEDILSFEEQEKRNKFKILKLLLRGFLKGLAKGALAASVITLITGGAGLIAFPLVLLIMGLTQGVKEAIDYKVALNLSSNMEKNKAYIIFDSLWNFISTLGFSILTLGTSLVKDLVSGSLGLIKGAYLWLWRNEPQSSLKEYYKEREPGFQLGYTITLFILAIGALVSSICPIVWLPYIIGGCCLAGAGLGTLNVRCNKNNKIFTNDNLNAAVLGTGAIAAVCLVLAPFSFGLSIPFGLVIIGMTMLLTRLIAPIFIKIKNDEVVQNAQLPPPDNKSSNKSDSTSSAITSKALSGKVIEQKRVQNNIKKMIVKEKSRATSANENEVSFIEKAAPENYKPKRMHK